MVFKVKTSLAFDLIMSSLLKIQPVAAMCVKWWLHKFDHKIMPRGFFFLPTLRTFTEVETLAALVGFKKKIFIMPICCTYQSLCMTFKSVFLFVFSLIFQHQKKFV